MLAGLTDVASIHAMLTPQTVAEAHHHARDRGRDRENPGCDTFQCIVMIAD